MCIEGSSVERPMFPLMLGGLLIAVLAVLLVAPPGHAATGWRPPGVVAAPATDAANLAESLPIARSYWPGSPCAGREQVLTDDEFIDRKHPDAQALGMADPTTCRAWVRTGLDATSFCFVLAHELGHLARRGHEDSGIMAPGSSSVGPCRVLLRRDAWYGTIARLPDAGRGWRLARKPGPYERVAIARHRGARCDRVVHFAQVDDAWVGALSMGRCR